MSFVSEAVRLDAEATIAANLEFDCAKPTSDLRRALRLSLVSVISRMEPVFLCLSCRFDTLSEDLRVILTHSERSQLSK